MNPSFLFQILDTIADGLFPAIWDSNIPILHGLVHSLLVQKSGRNSFFPTSSTLT